MSKEIHGEKKVKNPASAGLGAVGLNVCSGEELPMYGHWACAIPSLPVFEGNSPVSVTTRMPGHG